MFSWTLASNVPLIQEILQENGYVTIGVAGSEIFQSIGLSKGFIEFEISDKVSAVESVSEKMLRLIKKYINQDKPIFAFFHTYEIHSPYRPPKGYKKIFGEFKSDFKPTSPNLLKIVRDSSKLSDSDIDFLKAMYDCEIRYTDDILRNFFKELRRIHFLKNYIVIITADHGEEFGEHGGLLHRGLLYDELLHVPLIFIGNSVKKGVINHDLVNSVDIMPTILAYAGIKTVIPMEGRDLLSPTGISENQEQMVFSQIGRVRYSIRTHEWKLIESFSPYELELFNLKKDPHELKNIANEYPELRERFKDKIDNWKSKRLKFEELKKDSIQYNKEELEKLRTLGYIE
jgi:arylsulfatase A-like enzyme